MKPVIGVIAHYDEKKKINTVLNNYCEAIYESDGIPIILPVMREESYADDIFLKMDGMLLTGGVDVDPTVYGENPLNTLGNVSPFRDRQEIRLIKNAIKGDMPILAICRGIQVLNVAAGGTLYQDIPTQLKDSVMHEQNDIPSSHGIHSIDIVKNSRLATILGKSKIMVNSFHHQSVKDTADGFTICAKAPDGVIEAIESVKGFMLGVQWHPERMYLSSEQNKKLFISFVEYCRTKAFGIK